MVNVHLLKPESYRGIEHLANTEELGRPTTLCAQGLQQAAATQFAHNPSLQHSNLPKQQTSVKKYWQGTNKEGKSLPTIEPPRQWVNR